MILNQDNNKFHTYYYFVSKQRMVRRAIVAFEDEIGFEPERATEPAMVSLTRGLVMDHACRSNYDHCIGVAIDMFYDPNNNEVV